jgi:hypothetical protein
MGGLEEVLSSLKALKVGIWGRRGIWLVEKVLGISGRRLLKETVVLKKEPNPKEASTQPTLVSTTNISKQVVNSILILKYLKISL